MILMTVYQKKNSLLFTFIVVSCPAARALILILFNNVGVSRLDNSNAEWLIHLKLKSQNKNNFLSSHWKWSSWIFKNSAFISWFFLLYNTFLVTKLSFIFNTGVKANHFIFHAGKRMGPNPIVRSWFSLFIFCCFYAIVHPQRGTAETLLWKDWFTGSE